MSVLAAEDQDPVHHWTAVESSDWIRDWQPAAAATAGAEDAPPWFLTQLSPAASSWTLETRPAGTWRMDDDMMEIVETLYCLQVTLSRKVLSKLNILVSRQNAGSIEFKCFYRILELMQQRWNVQMFKLVAFWWILLCCQDNLLKLCNLGVSIE